MNFKVILLIVYLLEEFENVSAHDISSIIEVADDTVNNKIKVKDAFKEISRQISYRIRRESHLNKKAYKKIRKFESETQTKFIASGLPMDGSSTVHQLWDKAKKFHDMYINGKNKVLLQLNIFIQFSKNIDQKIQNRQGYTSITITFDLFIFSPFLWAF